MSRPNASIAFRFAPLAALVLSMIGLATLLRYDGVSGELEPAFSWRFARKNIPLPDTDGGRVVALPQDLSTTFTGFLGNDRNAVIPVREFSTDWRTNAPSLLFRQPIGEGWAGFAIAGDYGYTIEQRDDEEWYTCYNLDTGELIWKHVEQARHEQALGGIGPRSTPSLANGTVIAQGATGIVVCLNAADGSLVWRRDLLEIAKIDTSSDQEMVLWGRSGSPLVTGSMVVLPLGGKPPASSALVALERDSGEIRWTTLRESSGEAAEAIAMSGRSQISYASPILATLAGRQQIVSVNEQDVSGYDPIDGTPLWTHPWPGNSAGGASCSQPVPIGNDRILVSKGYGGGAMLLEVPGARETKVEVVWQIPSILKTKFSNVAIQGDYAFALSDGILECVEVSTGKRRWRQSRRGRYMHGQLLLVEDVLIVIAEDGRLALVEANSDVFTEIASIQAIEGKTWNNPAVAGRRLVVRNGTEAASFMLPAR